MDAVRVPPSASSTSQSIWTVRSPKASRSVTALSALPMSRWISWERPLGLPESRSREFRVLVDRGSMSYSAVTHPLPWPRRNPGTRSSNDAAHITLVAPIW